MENNPKWYLAAKDVLNGRGPFSILTGKIRFRGQEFKWEEINKLVISPLTFLPPAIAIIIFVAFWKFIKTHIPILDQIILDLTGLNAIYFIFGLVKPGGYRLLLLKLYSGKKHVAFVSSYISRPLLECWNDIKMTMPSFQRRHVK